MKCREYVMCPGFYQVLGIVFCVVVFIKCSVDACTCICQLLGYISSVGSLPSAHVGWCIKTVSSICLMSGYVPKQCQIFV